MQEQNRSAGNTLLLFTVLMFTLPIITFFLARDGLSLHYNYATFFSVLVVNIIIAVYVYLAFNEEEEETEEERRMKSGKMSAENQPKVGIFKDVGKTD